MGKISRGFYRKPLRKLIDISTPSMQHRIPNMDELVSFKNSLCDSDPDPAQGYQMGPDPDLALERYPATCFLGNSTRGRGVQKGRARKNPIL